MICVFKNQPEDSLYFSTLDFLRKISEEFILVKRKKRDFNEHSESLLKDLSLNLVKKTVSGQWPGTLLLNEGKAEIFYFKVNDDTINILKKYSNSLLNWLAPDLLEDLAFFRKDGSLILGSITHEKEFWLNLNLDEINIVDKQFPELKEGLIEEKEKI